MSQPIDPTLENGSKIVDLLRVFDELMLAQDSPSYPGSIVLRLEIDGPMDAKTLEDAAQYVAAANPLLRCHVADLKGNWFLRTRKIWAASTKRAPIVESSPAEIERLFSTGGYINLREHSGWRIALQLNHQKSHLYLFFHHACVDGKGAFEATNQLLRHYSQLQKQADTYPLASQDASTKTQAIWPSLSFPQILKLVPKQLVGLLGVRQFLMRKPIPIIDHQPFLGSNERPMPLAVISKRLDSNCIDLLRNQAKKLDGTINDILSFYLFRSLPSAMKFEGLDSNAWIRLMIPIDLRPDPKSWVCNSVSSVFLDRTPQQIENQIALFESIRDEMNLIKRNRLGYMLIFSLWTRRGLPGGIESEGSPKRCPTSLVFSNVGRVLEKFVEETSISIREIAFVPPLAPYVAAAFSATTLGKELNLALRYDPRLITAEHAENWLNLLAESFSNTIEGSTSPESFCQTGGDHQETVRWN